MIRNIWLASLIIIAIWGTLPILLKMLVDKHPTHIVMLMSAIMMGVMGVLFSFLFFTDVRKSITTFTKSDWMILIYIVVVGSLFSNLLYMYALRDHNSAVVVSVTSIFPIVTLALGAVLLKERVDPIAAVGIILVVAGIMLLAYTKPK